MIAHTTSDVGNKIVGMIVIACRQKNDYFSQNENHSGWYQKVCFKMINSKEISFLLSPVTS